MHSQIVKLVKDGVDLSTRQLFILLECLEKGDQTVKSLFESGSPGFDKPGVSRAVDRLLGLDYVTRKEHPTDRRMILVSLTKEGRKFINAVIKSGVSPSNS